MRTHADAPAARDMASPAMNERQKTRVHDAEERRRERVAVPEADLHQDTLDALLFHVLGERDRLVEAAERELDDPSEEVVVRALLAKSKRCRQREQLLRPQ